MAGTMREMMTKLSSYMDFLAAKAQQGAASGFDPVYMPDHLFGFQVALTDWAVRMGRAALFADCGLGKSPMALAWAENVHRHTGRPVLLVTPLAVTFQMQDESRKFGMPAGISKDGHVPEALTITNYERLDKFDPARFGGVVCDESSAIKSFDGKRRATVTEFARTIPYRLMSTATAAPNDYVELGTTSEALGYLGYTDMLGRFFTNKEKTIKAMGGRWKPHAGETWRFKGHAEEEFWRWVSSWARTIRKPSDLGFSDDGFVLPPLDYRVHTIATDGPPAQGLHEERKEARATLHDRCVMSAGLLADAAPGIAWCHLNDESSLLTEMIDGAVEVSGSDSTDSKEGKLADFSRGNIRVLVTKPKIGAWGLNWQHCHWMTYFPSHSYEQWYQAVRRSWRFGQQHPVVVDVVTTEGSARVFANLQRKAAQADRMFGSLTAHMRDAQVVRRGDVYGREAQVPSWAMS